MTSVDKVKALCKERKVAIYKLEKDLGFGNAYISQLKKGDIPIDRIYKIADYFGISASYFFDKEKSAQPELSEADKELFDVIGKLTDEEKKLMAGMGIAIMNRRGQK